jgi:hypothetical protein
MPCSARRISVADVVDEFQRMTGTGGYPET